MYPVEQHISIQPVANGYIVALPYQQPQYDPQYYQEQQIRKMARIMKDEVSGPNEIDQILRRAQQENEDTSTDAPISQPMIEKLDNVFIFETFDEVCIFLKNQLQ